MAAAAPSGRRTRSYESRPASRTARCTRDSASRTPSRRSPRNGPAFLPPCGAGHRFRVPACFPWACRDDATGMRAGCACRAGGHFQRSEFDDTSGSGVSSSCVPRNTVTANRSAAHPSAASLSHACFTSATGFVGRTRRGAVLHAVHGPLATGYRLAFPRANTMPVLAPVVHWHGACQCAHVRARASVSSGWLAS